MLGIRIMLETSNLETTHAYVVSENIYILVARPP